jgi:ABC-type branched-subunit amino acid transport system ATPase component/branched-subunit amino acid ABC-type transport system permease component
VSSLLPFIVVGLTTGAVYGLAGTGLVITYKTSGIFNFAHGATAAAAAYVFYGLHVSGGQPWIVSVIISVGVLGPVMGLILELIGRSIARQRVGLKVVATLGLILIVQGIASIAYGDQPLLVAQYLPKAGDSFRLGGVSITWAEVTILAISLVAVGALYLFFRYSRTGIAMRAVVDDPELIGLHGMRSHTIQRTAWIIGSSFAALSGVLIAPMVGIQAVQLTFLVVQAFGAAALGGFSDIPLTYVGGLLIGVLSSISTKYVVDVGWLTGLPASLPFIILIAVLVVMPQRRLALPSRAEQPARLPWTAPPSVRATAAVPVIVVLALIPQVAGLRLPFFTTGLTEAILILSLGLLVRTAGIISLCHAAFAAIGAVAYAQLIQNFSLPTLVAMLLAAVIVVPVAALLALPAVRLSGLFLALATFGFGLMMEQMFYPLPFMFTASGSGRPMPRPSFAQSDKAFYYFVLACFVVIAVVIALIHQGRLGRLLRGMGESPLSMRTLGVDLNVTRILTFCISGFIAAIGGILYGCGVHFAVLGDSNYSAFNSLVLVAILAIMPFGEPWYAVVAGITAVIPAYWHGTHTSAWLNLAFGVSAVLVAVQGGTQPMPARLRALLEERTERRKDRAAGRPMARAQDGEVARPGGERGLEVSDLTVRYGGSLAVADLTLVAPIGQITGLIGPNGAGKTTTFNAISGLVRPATGTVRLKSSDITRLDVSGRARRGVGRTFQTMQLADALTVADNVMLGYEAGQAGRSIRRHLWGGRADRNAAMSAVSQAMELCGIGALAEQQAGALSTGQRRLVELARCLAVRFDVLLLDEPSAGLDVAETARLGDLLLEVAASRGCGMLLVEHDMSLVLRVCTNIYVLDFGELICTGTPDEIRRSAVVKAAYLGTSDLGVGRVVQT